MAYRRMSENALVDEMPDSLFLGSFSEKARLKIQAAHEWHQYRKSCPTAQLKKLAYAKEGASVLLTQYALPSQVSAIIQRVSMLTEARFSSRKELSLVDESPVGVRVTLIKAAP